MAQEPERETMEPEAEATAETEEVREPASAAEPAEEPSVSGSDGIEGAEPVAESEGTVNSEERELEEGRPLSLEPLERTGGAGGANFEVVSDVPVVVTVELGSTTMPLAEVLELGIGSVVELDRSPGEPVDLLVNGKLVARGEILVIDEMFSFRVLSVPSEEAGRNRVSRNTRVA